MDPWAEITRLTGHIAPAHNTDFQRVTSPALRTLGDSVTEIWRQLQRYPGRFASISTEALFNGLAIETIPQMSDWWDYIAARYGWVREQV